MTRTMKRSPTVFFTLESSMTRFIVLVCVFAWAVSCAAMRPVSADVVDKIVVIVNSEVVTMSEVDSMIAPLYQEYKTRFSGQDLVQKVEEARKKAIDYLTEQKLLLSAAKEVKDKIEVTEKEVDEKVDEVKKRFPDEEAFKRALLQEHVSVKDLRLRYREQIMVRKYVDQMVIYKIKVAPNEMAEYYTVHKDEFGQQETVRVSNILLKVKEDPAENVAVSERIREIERRLKEGGDFAGLAEKYSEGPGAREGGLMGSVKRGELMKELEDVVFSLKPGEISGVVQSPIGYHIFRVDERVEARTKDFQEVRSEVESAVFQKKAQNGVQELVRKLRKNAYIAFK